MLFRPQMGSLREAMRHQREFSDATELADHIHGAFEAELTGVKLYQGVPDPRIEGWPQTYIVLARFGGGDERPVGFVNEPVGPIRNTEDYEKEFDAAFEAVLQRAWTTGLSRGQVARLIEAKLRKKYFQARVLPGG